MALSMDCSFGEQCRQIEFARAMLEGNSLVLDEVRGRFCLNLLQLRDRCESQAKRTLTVAHALMGMKGVLEGYYSLYSAIGASVVVLASAAHAVKAGRAQGEMSQLAYTVVYSVGGVEYSICISLSTLAAAMASTAEYKKDAAGATEGVFGRALTSSLNSKKCPGELAFSFAAVKTGCEVGHACGI